MHTVEIHTIGEKARAVIDAYLALPFGARPNCPYFNNRRSKTRGGLRVLIGKGSPAEITEETDILAQRSRITIDSLSKEHLKEFLVKNDIGIDCSGFAYHTLNAFFQEKAGKKLTRFMTSSRSGIVGSILARLRPAENMGVASFRNDRNSAPISIAEARPGDVIIFMGTGKNKTYNHILVITAIKNLVEGTDITYAHSYMWPSDGLYNHGVREGSIMVKNNNLLEGVWTEQQVSGTDNYTLQSARDAREISIRRLKCAI